MSDVVFLMLGFLYGTGISCLQVAVMFKTGRWARSTRPREPPMSDQGSTT